MYLMINELSRNGIICSNPLPPITGTLEEAAASSVTSTPATETAEVETGTGPEHAEMKKSNSP
jgi:hypothetical protein